MILKEGDIDQLRVISEYNAGNCSPLTKEDASVLARVIRDILDKLDREEQYQQEQSELNQ